MQKINQNRILKELLPWNIQEYIELGRKIHNFVRGKNQIGEYPTVRELAKKYHMRQGEILTLIEDNDDLEYNVGIGTYSGIYEYKSIGDYSVEAD